MKGYLAASVVMTAALAGTPGVRDMYIYVDLCVPPQGKYWGLPGLCGQIESMAAAGVNHAMLAFWQAPGNVVDMVALWGESDPCKKKAADKMKALGGRGVIMSTGGGNAPDWFTTPAATYANAACEFAKKGEFDGIDFDLEGIAQSNTDAYVKWLVAVSKIGHECIGWVSHAPQSPYFQSSWGNVYGKVVEQGGQYINKLLIQYYNQGDNANTYETLFKSFDGASISELTKKYPTYASLFVIGKYLKKDDGGNGWVSAPDMQQIVCKGELNDGYTGGVMLWQDHGQGGDDGFYSALSDSCTNQGPTTSSSSTTPRIITTTTTTTKPTTTKPTTTKIAITTTSSTTPTTTSSTTLPTSTSSTTPTTTPSTTLPTTTSSTTLPTTTSSTTLPTTTWSTPISTTSGIHTLPPPIPPAPYSNAVGECQATITSSIDTWTADCKSKCAYYYLSEFCKNAITGKTLKDCVCKQATYCH